MKWIIFDLDGTIADIEQRRALATRSNGKIHWGVFFDPINIELDKPIRTTIELLTSLKAMGYGIAIFSGRGSETKAATQDWLSKHKVSYDLLRMRPIEDYQPDDVLKRAWLHEEFEDRESLLCVFDDRDKVVNMWREEGLTCYQVNYGNF